MNGYMIRIISEAGDIRASACVSTRIAQTAALAHGTSGKVSAVFSRALTGALLMGSLIKGRERLALRFEGNGPVERIVVEADAHGGVRGVVRNARSFIPAEAEMHGVGAVLGSAGLLTVTRDLGLKELVTGTVHLVSGEIGADIAYYFHESEQIPTAVALGEIMTSEGDIAVCGGFLVQSLPSSSGASLESIVRMIESISPLSRLFADGHTPETILKQIFAEVPYKILAHEEVSYRCDCSRERMERGLIALGGKELTEIIDTEPTGITTNCEFCKTSYHFTPEELALLCHH